MSTVNTSERQSLYSEVTYRIIAELEAGRLPWVQPWDASRCPCTLPHNAGSGRTYSGINGAPYRREKKEEQNELSGLLVMACVHRTNLGQKWLRPRKRRGTTACPEKAQSVEAICDAAGQGKTGMAKAILPEPQFAATYTRSGAVEWLTRHIGWSESAMFMLSYQLVRRILCMEGQVNERGA
ncbi:ArdC-like ssDNA-binding domain-containing protein [Novosphingobium capsulatum]|uniref:ArdC-like ssDNA-binding domain-containing protein n=1 Tax=Novosphingobium capsulatum TaxID=13688 RepID=UPI0039905801